MNARLVARESAGAAAGAAANEPAAEPAPAASVSASRSKLSRFRKLTAGLVSGKRPLFALFQSVGTQALITAINVLTGVITARMLGPDGRGVYAAVTIWPQLLATLSIAGLGSAVVFRMRQSPETAGQTAGASLLVGSALSLLAIGLGVVLLPLFLSRYSPSVVLFAQICLVFVLVNSIQMLVKQAFAGIGEFGQYNLSNLLPQGLYLVALLAIMPFEHLTARDAILALLGAGVVALLAVLPKFVRLVRPQLKAGMSQLRGLVSYSARASLMDIVFALATYADRLVLIPMLPASELGLYAVAFSFSRVIQLVQPAIVSVIFSHMSGRTQSDGKRLHDYACRFLLAGLILGCAALWLIGQPLLSFTYGAEFGAANTIFRLLVVEASLGALSQVTVQLFLAGNRPGVVSTIQVIVLCLSVATLLVLVPLYGAEGAALGLMGAGVVRWLLLLGGVKLVLKLPLPRLYLNREDLRYMLGRLT